MAEHDGSGRILETYMEMDDKMGICCAFSLNKNFVEDYPEHAVRLLKAHQESVKYCYENPVGAAKIFAEYYNVPEEVAMKTMYMKCVNEGRTLTWEIEEDSFKHAYDVYKRYDLIEEEILPDFEDLIAFDIYEKADLDDFNKYIEDKVEEDFPLGMTYEDYKAKADEIYSKLEK